VPAGIWIGTTPRVAKIAQPLVQIAASVPATALSALSLLLRSGGGMGTVIRRDGCRKLAGPPRSGDHNVAHRRHDELHVWWRFYRFAATRYKLEA
jgi:hypothetical protein